MTKLDEMRAPVARTATAVLPGAETSSGDRPPSARDGAGGWTAPAWETLALPDLLTHAHDLVEDVTFPTVAEWRRGGGKVLGHFQVYFPEELAHAAGMLPVKMRGAQLDARDADSHFGSYLCSIIKTSLQLALGGNVQLDLFVTHPICDSARNLGAIWGRNVDYPCHILYLPQNPNSGYAATYLRDEYRRMLDTIEQVAGRTVSDDDLRASIQVFNQNRRLIRGLQKIRRDEPWKLAVDEAYALTLIGSMMPREEHNRLLEHALKTIEARQANSQDRLRVVYQGGFCEQPPLDLLHAIARSCYVVDDDLTLGMSWLTDDVPLEGDPLLNLSRGYIEADSFSPVQHDLRKPKEEMLLKMIRDAGADAAIITAAKMCEPGLEEQVAFAHTLDKEGIPYFVSEFEERMSSFDHLEIQLETFVERLMFA